MLCCFYISDIHFCFIKGDVWWDGFHRSVQVTGEHESVRNNERKSARRQRGRRICGRFFWVFTFSVSVFFTFIGIYEILQ